MLGFSGRWENKGLWALGHLGSWPSKDLPSLHSFQWWLVPMPYGLLIFVYDEIRKLGVRRHPGSESCPPHPCYVWPLHPPSWLYLHAAIFHP